MKRANVYIDLKDREIPLGDLPTEERALIDRLMAECQKAADWSAFRNFWMAQVAEFYSGQGLTRPQIRQTAGYRIGQDLNSRIIAMNSNR
jgi:hypothetical protein